MPMARRISISFRSGSHFSESYVLQTVIHRTERVADHWAKYKQGSNNKNGNQNKNQSIFDQSLATIAR